MTGRFLPGAGSLLPALCVVLAAGSALAQPPIGGPDAAAATATKRPARTAQARPESTPTWRELTPPQQQALAPLTATWSRLSEAHKRKWLALSANYPAMPPPEQARLHSRMAEWAALSPQQRTQARMNFAESKAVPTDDRKAKWEAYQALPPEEKRKLAARARAAKPPATAVAVQPESRPKLARPPTEEARPAGPNTRTPRIAGSPGPAATNSVQPLPDAAPPQR